MRIIKSFWSQFDLNSLQMRLTIGMITISSLGLSSLTIWTIGKMQQILVDSHKHNIKEIAERFPDDFRIYSQMTPREIALQKASDNLATTDTFLWVKSSDNKTLITSTNKFNSLSTSQLPEIINSASLSVNNKVYKIYDHYFVFFRKSIKINNKTLVTLFVAQDMTRDQAMFLMMVKSLSIINVLAVLGIVFIVLFYIKYSLQPLRQLNRMTEVISIKDLGQANLYIHKAPSEVKELAQTFSMMLSRLSQSWEQERQFVSNVSHELRTPLTIVHGYLQSVLRRQSNLTDMQRDALETAASEAQNTINLLQDLLDLARADSGYLHLHIEICIINDLVTEVVEMAKNYSQRVITVEETNYPIKAKADYSRLKQVLLNLINNAVQYSEANTTITIKLSQQLEQATIQVCDQGYGIALQHQSRIFERFYRVDETRNRSTGGAGLGLSIVKTLVEGMHGSVTVRSRLGEGSVFTISLPVLGSRS